METWDSANGQLKLTNAVRTALPALPTNFRREMVYQFSPALKNYYGNGPDSDGYSNPIFRYGH